MESNPALFDEFPPVSRETWEDLIENDLRGADYKTKLKWHTGEGIEALPFYRREDIDALFPAIAREAGDWELRQSLVEEDVAKANDVARKALESGAEALTFVLNPYGAEESKGGNLQGVAIQDQQAFERLVKDIDITKTAVHFDAGAASPMILAMLSNKIEAQGLKTDVVSGSVLFDPYAFALTRGNFPGGKDVFINDFKQMLLFCDKNLPGMRSLGIDARVYQHAGGTIVQEVAYALATASEYMAGLSEAGLSPDLIASAMHFTFAIGSRYFLEIAKFRAMRQLWHTLIKAYDVEEVPAARLHGSSSRWNKTCYDPYINMLRATTEGMSAAIAGCDAITLHPFDETFHQPDAFSRRIARNTQIILKEEAYFNKVADPAAGSYYIDKLTDKIAKAAWGRFREIEAKGGFKEVIAAGHIQDKIQASRRKKDQAIARRERVFVGVNQYPDTSNGSSDEQIAEKPIVPMKVAGLDADIDRSRLMASLKNSLKDGCALGDLFPVLYDTKKPEIAVIQPYRGAQAFEELRHATEQHATTPSVLIAAIGDRKIRKARASFAANFLGCAGYDIENSGGFTSVGEVLETVEKEKPEILVLCSSDESYKTLVPELCKALKSLQQKPLMVLAGYPEEEIEHYKEAGIDLCIHTNSNALETLNNIQKKLGIIKN